MIREERECKRRETSNQVDVSICVSYRPECQFSKLWTPRLVSRSTFASTILRALIIRSISARLFRRYDIKFGYLFALFIGLIYRLSNQISRHPIPLRCCFLPYFLISFRLSLLFAFACVFFGWCIFSFGLLLGRVNH